MHGHKNEICFQNAVGILANVQNAGNFIKKL